MNDRVKKKCVIVRTSRAEKNPSNPALKCDWKFFLSSSSHVRTKTNKQKKHKNSTHKATVLQTMHQVAYLRGHNVCGKRTGVRFHVKLSGISGTVVMRAPEIVILDGGTKALREYLEYLRSCNLNRFTRMVKNSPSLLDYLKEIELCDEDTEEDNQDIRTTIGRW